MPGHRAGIVPFTQIRQSKHGADFPFRFLCIISDECQSIVSGLNSGNPFNIDIPAGIEMEPVPQLSRMVKFFTVTSLHPMKTAPV